MLIQELAPEFLINDLRDRCRQYYYIKYPSFPKEEVDQICKGKKYNIKTTGGITKMCVDLVTFSGQHANRINVTGRVITTKDHKTASGGFIEGKTIRIPSTTKRGTADLDIVAFGLAIKAEIKNANTRDVMSDAQNKMRSQIEAAGGIYWVIESYAAFYRRWISFLSERQRA